MKVSSLLRPVLWLLVMGANLDAFDWPAAFENAGAVEVTNMALRPLEPSKEDGPSWSAVPANLQKFHARIFKSPSKNISGAVDYRVTKGGWVFVAGHFGKEGSNGDWQKERWEAKDLIKDGWVQISADEAGGPLLDQANQPYDLFAKRVQPGGSAHLRLNKHTLPYFIVLGGGSETISTTTAAVKSISPTTADLVKTQHNNLVFVNGANGSAGSGFIAELGGASFLFTNAHVAAGVKGAGFTTLSGEKIPAGASAVAVDHDIFRIAFTPKDKPFEIMTGVDGNVAIGDEVVVLGNAEGAGVINTIGGKIIGIGPNLVEVDAAFVPGNSGSPIVHLKSGKVIAVATYALIRKYDTTTKEPMRNAVIRRFGYRLDSVKTWQPVNWSLFSAQATEMENIENLTRDLEALISDVGAHHKITPGLHNNPALKQPIDLWLADHGRQLSPSDRAMSEQNFVSRLKLACQGDLNAVRPRLTYDYFQRELTKEKGYRDDISTVLDKFFQPGPHH